MILQWYGHACFKLSSNNCDTSIVIDPFGPQSGKLSRLSSDIALSTTDDDLHNALDAIKGAHDKLKTIMNPGEYEIGGIFIQGKGVLQKDAAEKPQWTSIYSLKIDDLFVTHLGALNRDLSEAELDILGHTDILLLPIGGRGVLDHKKAVELISEIEPRIVIPMDYYVPGSKIEREKLEAFLKEYGSKQPETLEKLKIAKKDLPAEETKVVILTQV